MQEGKVVKISGLVKEGDNYDGKKVVYELYAKTIQTLPKRLQRVIISVKVLTDYADNLLPRLYELKGNDYEVLIHDKMLGEVRKTNLKVRESLFQAGLHYEITLYNGEL